MPSSMSLAAGLLASSGASAADLFEASAGLRGARGRSLGSARAGVVDNVTGILSGDTFALQKRYDLGHDPWEDWNVEAHTDEFLTHSCANYTDDGSTVFSRDGDLVLKVASHCEGGGCMNSGRVMSKENFKYGLFSFTAMVPKCNSIWPAIWLLPGDVHGSGAYGTWPCSGEIDVLETVHDGGFGTFNLVAGYGTDGMGCKVSSPATEIACDRCQPNYCTSTTMEWHTFEGLNPYFVEPKIDCKAGEQNSWVEHTWVFDWQRDQLTTWVDPVMTFDDAGNILSVKPLETPAEAGGIPMWKSFKRETSPTWQAVGEYMDKCFPDEAAPDAPFDLGMKIVLNIAIGGYGGAPCTWGSDSCQSVCGGAVGSEMVMKDISVYQRKD